MKTMKERILRLLILEDNPDDAELAVEELMHNGFKMDWTRVESEKSFKREIFSGEYDLILADYSLPSFNGLDALRIQQEQTPEIPLIIISGTIGEEVAIECLKSGAIDYVLKDRINRLSSVVERALREAELLREQKLAEEREKVHRSNIEFLSQTAMQFVKMSYEEDIYRFIAEQLSNLTGKSIIAVNSIDWKNDTLATRTVVGLGNLAEKAAGILGRDPEGMTYDGRNENLNILLDGKLHVSEEGLYGVMLKEVPKRVCRTLENLFNINGILTLGFSKENKLLGTAVILISGVIEIKNREVIEAFAKQASIALQRRQIERNLLESEKHLRTIFEASEDCIFIKNCSRKYTHINPAIEKLFGKPAGEIIGCTDEELFGAEAEIHVSGMDSRVLNGEIVEEEHTKPVNGVPATFHVIKVPMRDSSGEIVGLLGSARNITERILNEQELRRKNKELKTFNKLAVGRELKMVELKREINRLLEELGKEPEFKLDDSGIEENR